MSLLHHFGIATTASQDYRDQRVRRGWCKYHELLESIQHPVTLHDDFISYIYDSLEWIPSFNPSKQSEQKGLCRWGVTVIDWKGATTGAAVFDAWAQLFGTGPQKLQLTGGFTYIEEDPGSGKYQELNFDREETVWTLRAISSMCERIVQGNGEEYLLHLGI